MKTRSLKKILTWTVSVFLLLAGVLLLHIYFVTRPTKMDAHYKVMVRLDLKQKITPPEEKNIAEWLRSQDAVDHVGAIGEGQHILFTCYPAKSDANDIINRLTTKFKLTGERYLPTEAEMKSGCPVAGNSPAYKAIVSLTNLF